MMEAEQRREWIKSRRKKRNQTRHARLRRQILRYSLLLLLLTGGAAGFTKLPWHISSPDCEIVVKSNHVVSDQQVRDSLRTSLFAPLYTLDPKQLENQVSELKAVKRAFVRRYAFPEPKIVVEIQEEVPWATFSLSPESPPLAVIAQSGKMIPIKDFPNVEQPPLQIYGVPTMRLTPETVGQWASWISLITQQTNEPVNSIDMRKAFDVRVQNGSYNLKLGTPDMSLTRRLGRICSILGAVEPLKDRLQYIDLGLDNNIPLKVSKEDATKARREAQNGSTRQPQNSQQLTVTNTNTAPVPMAQSPTGSELNQVVQQSPQDVPTQPTSEMAASPNPGTF